LTSLILYIWNLLVFADAYYISSVNDDNARMLDCLIVENKKT